ncbi:hypothetical protein F7734_51670 [Scytonema sp. UIC 10036]|uniref:hypothetical protein n=1 Tax=Scytonema sp. UIC 10036 TaxID=2304196 RepID=UPI0012DABE97|nr:hypothetical protein [Scytonema sp. UIC 10036]MUH00288.1 hypothetical protein [Scytonema sp. UIC 10036]
MNSPDNTPTSEQIAIFQALDEIDKDPCIGRLTKEEKDFFFDHFFSNEAKMERLQRIRQRKQALEQQLAKVAAMEKQLLENLQE